MLSARAAVTKYRRLGGLTTENYCLSVLEARSPQSRCQQGFISSEARLLGLQKALFSLCLHTVFPLCAS